MRKMFLTVLLVISLSFVLAACGGGGSESAPAEDNGVGNVANGEKLFNQTVIGSASAPGCITCHSLEEGVVLVGPSHSDIGARAEGAVAGLSPEEYLRQSILEPNAHITEGYAEGVMYQNYGEELPAPNIDDLVAFMLSLDGE